MERRYVSIWFHHLKTDWFTRQDPSLTDQPLVLCSPSHGRLMITATNRIAETLGIFIGTTVADARAIHPGLTVMDDLPGLSSRLLHRIAGWCLLFSPVVNIDGEDGLLMDATGCSHLWEGEYSFVSAIMQRLKNKGYESNAAIADTIGAAWAVARFGGKSFIVEPGRQLQALQELPAAALRIEPQVTERLLKLGLRQIGNFISMPGASLRRRFGPEIITRIGQALGCESETIEPLIPPVPYQERLPCLEPISTLTGIQIGLNLLLEQICHRLHQEQMGLRKAVFKCYRTDGKTETTEIGTSWPSANIQHLYKLFEIKLDTITPGPGIELFILEAPTIETLTPSQEQLWETANGLQDHRLTELIDRLAGRIGMNQINRYLPDEHYWPERSMKRAESLQEIPTISWRTDKPRPLQLLPSPERIEVMAPIPDYPPMLFRYKGKSHRIVKADGPERIEQEWWIQQGEHRDYYNVEDEEAGRYWLFREGHYSGDKSPHWFIHGFFS
ncbi:MAG: DNA polymerase Y family protein [Chitinophagaceae bacterium]